MGKKVQNLADRKTLAYVGSLKENRDSDAWYTPQKYVEAARMVLGGIGIDPFSSAKANERIRALTYLGAEEDAFRTPWDNPINTCFMNPPYSRGFCQDACERFIQQFDAGKFDAAIVLVNNASDTRWFKMLETRCAAMGMTDHRIAFVSPDDKRVSGNTRGQTFFLFCKPKKGSPLKSRFRKEFGVFCQRIWS